MLTCPNCLYKNMAGSVFCSECGSQLVYTDSHKTGKVQATDGYKVKSSSELSSKPRPAPSAPFPDAPISLHVLNSGVFLPIPEGEEAILGRASTGQSMVPDINLDPYHAFEAGVSRIHAAIRIEEDQVFITDLGSGNGTRINGNKIEPNKPHPLEDGDFLNLGKFKMQVRIRSKSK